MTMPSLSEEDLRAFVGPRADYYLTRWHALLTGQRRGAGANLAALFLTVFWLLYRKMYRVAAILVTLVILLATLEEILFRGLGIWPGLLVAAACGLFGNGWYFRQARRALQRVSADNLPRAECLKTLRSRGGTSLWPPLLFGALLLLGALLTEA